MLAAGLTGTGPGKPPSACEGIAVPRALAAFVNRQQATLFMPTLKIFYNS